jgi:Mce-associated membrane protein
VTQANGRRTAWWALVIALTVATLGAATLGGWQMQMKSRQPPADQLPADQLADRQAATEAASMGTVKVLTYSHDTLDQDFSAAEAMLTGEFLTYYKQFTSQTVGPTAQQKRLSQTAIAVRSGVETLTSDQAAILVFVNQTTTSQEKPSPTTTSSSVRVGLAKVNGIWLINKLDPV